MKRDFSFFPLLFIALLAAFAFFGKSPKTYPESLIERIDTPDGPIIVFERDGMHLMSFNEENWNFVESAYDPNTPFALPAEYTRYLTAALMYPAHAQRILMIGMGGGQTTTYLHHHMPDADITAVEIDPYVVEAARKYFGFNETENYHAAVADGLEYLRTQNTPYDIIILDAFSDGRIPQHLSTPEFYREVAEHMSGDGAVSQNVETVNTRTKDVIAAMNNAFAHVDSYRAGRNFVLVGYNGETKSEENLRAQAQALQETYGFRYALPDFLRTRQAIK